MPTDENDESSKFLVPSIAQDLAMKEIRAMLRSPQFMERARGLLARRRASVYLLYFVTTVLTVGAFAAGIWGGARLMGLPLWQGEEVRQDYPLSFMVRPSMEPWGRYLYLVSIVGFTNVVLAPVSVLRRKLVSAWAAADEQGPG